MFVPDLSPTGDGTCAAGQAQRVLRPTLRRRPAALGAIAGPLRWPLAHAAEAARDRSWVSPIHRVL